MSIKKKLGMGIATLSLGAVMALGGTFAAFNDVETVQNSLAAGTLDLDLGQLEQGYDHQFILSNLKPGDTMVRYIKLTNNGSLAIKEVFFDANLVSFTNGVNEFVADNPSWENNEDDFLKQFKVNMLRARESGDGQTPPDPDTDLILPGETLTLYDLVKGNPIPKIQPAFLVDRDGVGGYDSIDIVAFSPNSSHDGIPTDPTENSWLRIDLEFIDDPATLDGVLYTQNRYQGDSVAFNFSFEATQWDGINGKTNNYHENENKKANPQDQ